MPRELVTISVGQAGNQIGQRFWEMAVKEHAAHNTDGLFHACMSTLFRNIDSRTGLAVDAAAVGCSKAAAAWGRPPAPIADLRARAVLVDMEHSVVAGVLKSPLGELFDSCQMLTDVSGSGNNWAHGYGQYGPQYREALSGAFHTQVEACDSLQGFMLLHSLGGGTGSGLGSFILEQLQDEYPEVQRFSTPVFPSANDDVVTSPYNALLSLSKLAEHADCVLPVDNAALQTVCAAQPGGRCLRAASSQHPDGKAASGNPFNDVNGAVGNLLLHLTSSARFEGQLNMDLNEVVTNLVPYPRLHFLTAAMWPRSSPRPAAARTPAAVDRALEQACMDVLAPGHQLVSLHPKRGCYLACTLLARGAVVPADLDRNIRRMRQHMRMPAWNPDAFKTGICSCPPVDTPLSLLCLANNCGMSSIVSAMQQRFQQLYRRRLYTHHYEQYVELAEFEAANETASWLVDSYKQLNDASRPPDLKLLRPQEHSSYGQNSLR